MGLLSKFFGPEEEIKPEEAVLIYVKLSDSEFGTGEEQELYSGTLITRASGGFEPSLRCAPAKRRHIIDDYNEGGTTRLASNT